jgi:hypothetical protein
VTSPGFKQQLLPVQPQPLPSPPAQRHNSSRKSAAVILYMSDLAAAAAKQQQYVLHKGTQQRFILYMSDLSAAAAKQQHGGSGRPAAACRWHGSGSRNQTDVWPHQAGKCVTSLIHAVVVWHSQDSSSSGPAAELNHTSRLAEHKPDCPPAACVPPTCQADRQWAAVAARSYCRCLQVPC